MSKKMKPFGLQFTDIDNLKMKPVEATNNLIQLKDKSTYHFSIDDIEKYFITSGLFTKYDASLFELIERCLPVGLEKKCKFCKKESTNESDRICENYRAQMFTTFLVAAKFFDDIIQNNKHIIKDKLLIEKLAQKFYFCFKGIKESGTLYFDPTQLSIEVLKAGFLTLSKQINENPLFKEMEKINNSIDKIEVFELTKEFNNEKPPLFPKKQKKFFKQKQKYLKNKLRIEKEQKRNHKVTEPKSTIEIFNNTKDYKSIISQLENEGLIRSKGATFVWNGYKNNPKKEKYYDCVELKSIQALGINLKLKNYFKTGTKNTAIIALLNELFDFKIVSSTYNKVHNELKEDSNSLYYTLFDFIKPKY